MRFFCFCFCFCWEAAGAGPVKSWTVLGARRGVRMCVRYICAPVYFLSYLCALCTTVSVFPVHQPGSSSAGRVTGRAASWSRMRTRCDGCNMLKLSEKDTPLGLIRRVGFDTSVLICLLCLFYQRQIYSTNNGCFDFQEEKASR